MIFQIIRYHAFDFSSAAEKAYKDMLASSGVDKEDVSYGYATEYGRDSIKFAEKTVSEITAHTKDVINQLIAFGLSLR